MLKNKMHLVPQIVIDCADNYKASKIEHMRESYLTRLEAIRDYCDSVIKNTPTLPFPKKNNSAR